MLVCVRQGGDQWLNGASVHQLAQNLCHWPPDYWLRVTTAEGTFARRHPPPRYSWADPSYDVVHSSMVPCLANLLGALCAGDATAAETHAEDNLKTLRLVFAAYDSARDDRVIAIEA